MQIRGSAREWEEDAHKPNVPPSTPKSKCKKLTRRRKKTEVHTEQDENEVKMKTTKRRGWLYVERGVRSWNNEWERDANNEKRERKGETK